MNNLAAPAPHIPAMSPDAIDRAQRLTEASLMLPQVEIQTQHVLHAGIYARTIRIPAGVLLTGVVIKVPTVLVFDGHCTVYVGDDKTVELAGYHVLPAEAGRKQVFLAHADTMLTMMFPTDARTVTEAESQFTDEADMLLSRQQDAAQIELITGE
ncbi:hypothetical protein G3T20_05765 [Bordetella hinzii]|uniref:hypothetical protein n=1 Tax=Bordetella hinzii TaxID=103855 RepID=UPI0013EFCA27|nr:hypothetical protein [Bordetella hinzii]QII84251.1 hypothetical protein G3T20_05765 [Bordetella hinzii]